MSRQAGTKAKTAENTDPTMAGTRLAVHTTFVVQLLILVAASLYYASFETRDGSSLSPPEPFFADQSGWNIVVEDVSPVNDGGVVDRAGEVLDSILSRFYSLLGIDSDAQYAGTDVPRPPSVFVQEMRQKISELSLVTFLDKEGKSYLQPSLKMKFVVPSQMDANADRGGDKTKKALILAETLREGMRRKHGTQKVELLVEPLILSNNESCDEWKRPAQIIPAPSSFDQQRQVRLPEIILLTGCTIATIPEPYLATIEVDKHSEDIVIRTTYNLNESGSTVGEDKEWQKFQHLLDINVSHILSGIISSKRGVSPKMYKLGSLDIQLIDEDPMNHDIEGGDGVDGIPAKVHFNLLGKALLSSVNKMINPLLEKFSFLYGGDIEIMSDKDESVMHSNRNIRVTAQTAGYLSLPDEIVELDTSDGATKFVSMDNLSKWIHAHLYQSASNNIDGYAVIDYLEWVLYLPSQARSPLQVRDGSVGGEGHSITLSPPSIDGGRDGSAIPAGLTLVGYDDFTKNKSAYTGSDGKVDLGKVYQSIERSMSHSLNYLVGYIRACHGLPSSAMSPYSFFSTSKTLVTHSGESNGNVYFWELESIAQKHWHKILEQVLQELDDVMSLLHKHASTLALPEQVSYVMISYASILRVTTSWK